MNFQIDPIASVSIILLLILFVLLYLFVLRKTDRFKATPSFFWFASLAPYKELHKKGRARWVAWPYYLKSLSFVCFLVAFLDPKLASQKNLFEEIPKEGRAIYFILDRSGSMAKSSVAFAHTDTSKIEILKEIVSDFIVSRPQDMFGLVTFARTAQVEVPLTLDRKSLFKALNRLQVVQNKEEDGTAIGYAIYKTANVIAATRYYAQEIKEGAPSYAVLKSMMILVTDGFQAPHSADSGNSLRTIALYDAARYALEKEVNLYVINIDPALAKTEFSPHRNQMRKVAELTGGKFYMLNEGSSLSSVFEDIDKIEKGITQEEKKEIKYEYLFFFPYLISLGLFFFFLSLLLETTLLRKLP